MTKQKHSTVLFTSKHIFQLFITTALVFLNSNVFAQLNGYYTVGDTNSDYSSLYEATDDLYAQGIDGNVTLALMPGNYSGITFNAIPGTSSSNYLTIQSEALDSTTVTIEGTIGFQESNYIKIQALTISTSFSRAINFFESKGIRVENCLINTSYNSSSSDGAIQIRHNFNGPLSDFTLKNCTVNSPELSIYSSGDKGATTISNCEINTDEGISIHVKYASNTNISYNNINGGVDIDSYENSNFIGNYVTGPVEIGLLDSVIDNIFHSDEEYRISSFLYRGNQFYEQSFRFASYGTTSNIRFYENYFEGSIHLSFATDITMQLNTFIDGVSLSFSKKLLFTNNKVTGGLSYGDASSSNWYYRIYNNIFFNDVLLARGHNSIISYNNFLNDAILRVEYADIKVYDNNFSSGIVGNPSLDNVNHNNYFPVIYNYYDENSVHYDPEYDANDPGKATNPLLQGKGWSQSPLVDIVGTQRKNPPAIGANEIYICSDSINNEISVPCSEEVFVNLCDLPNTGDFWWTPDTCVQNPNSAYTMITACESGTWYLYNSISGLIDSVTIQTTPFQVEIAETPLIYCGYGRTLNASYHPDANYHWTPEFGLSDPNIRNPILNPIDTINLQYILESEIEGCGVSYDTIVVDYDPLPNVAMYFPMQNNDTVYFSNNSICADQYFWEFGDGGTSTEENPMHIYEEPDVYTITLTGTNDYGSRSASVSLPFFWVGIDTDLIEELLKIYPNPANNTLHIEGLPANRETELRIHNPSGNEIIFKKIFENKTFIDLSELENGIYFIQFKTGTKTYSKKIVVVH